MQEIITIKSIAFRTGKASFDFNWTPRHVRINIFPSFKRHYSKTCKHCRLKKPVTFTYLNIRSPLRRLYTNNNSSWRLYFVESHMSYPTWTTDSDELYVIMVIHWVRISTYSFDACGGVRNDVTGQRSLLSTLVMDSIFFQNWSRDIDDVWYCLWILMLSGDTHSHDE